MLHENIYARSVEVAGTYYRDRSSAEFISTSGNRAVELQLEPSNKYDRFAIKVIGNGLHIGYIPSHLAERIYKDDLQLLLGARLVLATFKGKTNLIVIDLYIGEENLK